MECCGDFGLERTLNEGGEEIGAGERDGMDGWMDGWWMLDSHDGRRSIRYQKCCLKIECIRDLFGLKWKLISRRLLT